jgi:molecular chaperone DnaK
VAFIGIDLGTTFSSVATIDETGRPVPVLNSDGDNITPSCIRIEGNNSIVGEEARRDLFIPNTHAVGRFKREMGTDKTYLLDGHQLTPTELSSLLLQRLKKDAEFALGNVGEAVVTIPANFSHEARDATMAAAKSAGLNVKYIINEPTAAALYYAFKSDQRMSGIYAVYDLGGGTFDVSIIKLDGQDVEVLSTNGVSKLGGDDFDGALQKLVKEKFKSQTGEELHDEDFTKNDAEEEKKSLSRREKVTIRVARKIIEITRAEFEESISSLIAQAEMLCESAIDEADVNPGDIKSVFFAGGSTRIPAIKESVKRIFGQEPVSSANVDLVVSLGAALYAAHKGDKSKLSNVQKNAIDKISVADKTSMYFGTISISSDNARGEGRLHNSILIHKGEVVPCEVTESFYTVAEGQTAVNCRITESRSPETDPKFVKVIWEGDLSLPAGREAQQEIKITYAYDENQIMNCRFLDVGTNRETAIELSMASAAMDSSGIEKFTVE